MSLFGGKESKEEKHQSELKKLGLEELSNQDLEIVKSILAKLDNKRLLIGQSSNINAADVLKLNANWAQVEQNWIIIRQLYKLNKNIETLIKNGK